MPDKPSAPPWREVALSGWGRTARATCRAARPERLSALRAALAQVDGTGVIAHGAGRSYGDAALNTGGHAILTRRLDRLLAFDPVSGELTAEPGVDFATLLEVFLPRGWLPPVVPGTAFATLGGAVANDVHGKNHETDGGFGRHLRWVELLTAAGDTVRASRTEHPELFAATLGGVGLTGIVTRLCLTLRPVPGNAAHVRLRRLPDLDAVLAALAANPADRPWSVAWIDALASGRHLGRGILETAAPARATLPDRPARTLSLPVNLPGFVLSAPLVRAFNGIYWRRVPVAGTERLLPWRRFLCPLDAIGDWNRMYGRSGFHQFQCVVPPPGAPAAVRRLLETLATAGRGSFLAVLKALGAEGEGMLSFPRPGLTLAVDLPNRPGVGEVLARLEQLTLEAGGRVYLAKDSVLGPAAFAAMYPRLPEFRTTLERWDPQGLFVGDLARRLGIRGGAAARRGIAA